VTEAEIAQFLQAEAASVAPSPKAGLEMWTLHEVTLHASTPSDSVNGIHALVRALAIFGLFCSFALLIFKDHLPKVAQLGGKSKKSEFSI